MKLAIFAFVSSAFVASAAITGTLKVTYADEQVAIKGDVTGLEKSVTGGGIHVHSGEDCTNGGKTTAGDVDKHVGGHLMSGYIDNWIPTTYNTNDAGKSTIDVSAGYFVLAKAKGTDAVPSVEDRCIVLHGVSQTSLKDRAAIGQIKKNNDKYTATIKKYPGPNTIATTPAGTLTVTVDDKGVVKLAGDLTGLGKSMTKAGIHIHTGTDCTGGSDLKTKEAVNKVVGGHLFSKGDGFLTTKYTSDDKGAAKVDIKTPKGGYTLLNKDGNAKTPGVENNCIVIHDKANARVGIGQIKCTAGNCEATIGAYPTAAKADDKKTTKKGDDKKTTKKTDDKKTTKKTDDKKTTKKPDDKKTGSATQMFTAFSALVVSAVLAF